MRYSPPPIIGNLRQSRLAPLPDELLSSWLVRLSERHGRKPYGFCALHFPKLPVWNRDIDLHQPEGFLATVAARTGLPENIVGSLTLSNSPTCRSGTCPWILSAGIYHRTRKRWGLQFCPECLATDPIPYFRRRWRLAFMTLCDIHRCALRDSCPHCDAPVVPHRTSDCRTRCFRCGRRLLVDHPPLSKTSVERILTLQRRCMRAWTKTSVELRDVHSDATGSDMLQGLRILVRMPGCRAARRRLAVALRLPTDMLRTTARAWEHKRLEDRRVIFEALARLVERWPVNFLRYATQTKLTQGVITNQRSAHVPDWLRVVVEHSLPKVPAPCALPRRRRKSTTRDPLLLLHRRWRREHSPLAQRRQERAELLAGLAAALRSAHGS